MTMARRTLSALAVCCGIALFVWALSDTAVLYGSADSYRLHHEVTTPLLVQLAKFVAALFCGGLALGALGKSKKIGFESPTAFVALLFVVALMVVGGTVLKNQAFFTLYDYKGYPVHPTEIVAHPFGGWLTPGDHAILCLLGLAAGGLFLWLTRHHGVDE